MSDISDRIEQANAEVVNRILSADPIWIDVRPAREVLPGVTENTYLHAVCRVHDGLAPGHRERDDGEVELGEVVEHFSGQPAIADLPDERGRDDPGEDGRAGTDAIVQFVAHCERAGPQRLERHTALRAGDRGERRHPDVANPAHVREGLIVKAPTGLGQITPATAGRVA